MIWQYRHKLQALLIGLIILFPWCGIIGMADAESGDTQDHGKTSVSKRQGQSPASKPSKAASSGTAPVRKRQGQAPASNPTSKAAPKDTGENNIPVDDRRQGQSPGNE
jgi:hypothetical protein